MKKILKVLFGVYGIFLFILEEISGSIVFVGYVLGLTGMIIGTLMTIFSIREIASQFQATGELFTANLFIPLITVGMVFLGFYLPRRFNRFLSRFIVEQKINLSNLKNTEFPPKRDGDKGHEGISEEEEECEE